MRSRTGHRAFSENRLKLHADRYKKNFTSSAIEDALIELRRRELNSGGFPLLKGGPYQPDASAWAVLALEAAGCQEELLNRAREMLVRSQLSDGRVVFAPRLGAAYWATPLAILAWMGAPAFLEAQTRSVEFLLSTGGLHPDIPDPIFGHDPSLRGWPWIEGTHSWVEPTSLTLLALKACGRRHKRMSEAVLMILNRQLPSGGWNYGNTTVFGTELWPLPECTGLALDALAGLVTKESVLHSLEYMKGAAAHIRTPLSLVWGILGLGSWSERPDTAREQVAESLALQKRYGSYDTSLLAQLIVAYHAKAGLLSLFPAREAP